jgi:hypothetical protein
MSQPEKAEAKEADKAVELAEVEAAEVVENAEAVELSQEAVEEEVAEVVDAAVEAVEAEAEPVEDKQFSQSEFVKIVADFGADIATKVVTNGGDYADARELHYQAEKAELESLRKQVAELQAAKPSVSGASPIAFADGEKRKTKMSFVEAVAAKARGEL